jgi:hypothetical protein
MARSDLWARRLELDASSGASTQAVGDVTTLEWVRDRIPLALANGSRVDDELRSLEASADSGEIAYTAAAAARLCASMAAHAHSR